MERVQAPNDPSSATRPTGRVDCNWSALAGLADGMGLGMELIELDGRRGRSIRLASEMGLANNDRTKTEAQYRQGLERCSGA